MISVVISNYNYCRFLEDCIASCKGADEIVVVDDCSTDESAKLLRAHEEIHTIYLPKNLGVANARNVGIRASGGDFIVVLDADDMLVPGGIEARMKMFKADPKLDVIYGQMLKVGESETYESACQKIKTLQKHPSEFTTPIYRRGVFERFGLYHTELKSKEDKEITYRLGVHRKSYCKPRVYFARTEEPVYFYRRHESAKRKARTIDIMYDITTLMAFDKRCKELELNGITQGNTVMI